MTNMIMKFAPSQSPGIVGYKMYMEKIPNLAHRGSYQIYLGMPPIDPADGKMYVNLAELDEIPTDTTRYNIGLVAFDDQGKESFFSRANNVKLEFDAPDSPGEIDFVQSI